MAWQIKYVGKSKLYKYVYEEECKGVTKWIGKVGSNKKTGFKTEREAALWVDKMLLSKGKEPVNILKRK